MLIKEFETWVTDKVGTRNWHVCPYMTSGLRKRGVEYALHPLRYKRWIQDFLGKATASGDDEKPSVAAFEMLRRIGGHEWIGRHRDGSLFLPDGEDLPNDGLDDLVRLKLVEPAADGLFEGFSQTYRVIR